MLGILHHIDHVLRVDHSGWPFRDVVTPFTFSLLAYPILLFALLGPRRWFWARWALLAAGPVGMSMSRRRWGLRAAANAAHIGAAAVLAVIVTRREVMGWARNLCP
ncbi:hypothetical protein [Sphingomonas sp. AX6]|uniref:hypothetical protein n=1 Tax=Sphingomonas sp. AX6 TaxID=2653171 RepID=UPI0012EF5BB9|nr:hypothetical protein [Sphingomonas sp. AX6]VXC84113.1 hypothetical protein SPHINGOAX6_50381 [Sphingomonas sp. AX6]